MNTKWAGYLTLFLFIALAALGFIVWVGLVFVIWLLLRTVGIPTNFWAMIEALSTAVTAAAVLSAGFVAYRELSEAASSRHMEVTNRLFEELNSTENIAARRWIFQNLHDKPEEEVLRITEEGRAAIKQVLNSLDHVAFLTQVAWIPDEIIMPWMHPMIAKSWEILEPFVYYERRRRNEPYFYQYVERLAKRCHSWQIKNYPDWKVVWVEDAL